MIYTLKNEQLTVQLCDLGAEIVSVRGEGDCEYIWQGDPAYWTGHAPLMFPICGRLFDGKYTYGGNTYCMGNHGFARRSVFEAETVESDFVRFVLRDNDETRAMYPFAFEFVVEYRLTDCRLHSRITIINPGETLLPAVVGLHPAFNVPLGGDGAFDDWYVEFAEPCSPDEILTIPTGFLTGRRRAYDLEAGRIIRLRHEMFDPDSIFFSNVCREVTLRSEKSRRFVRFLFPDMPYMGIWHKPKSDAPYLCIEPWCGLSAYDGEIDDLARKSDMFRLQPKGEKTVNYTLIFG